MCVLGSGAPLLGPIGSDSYAHLSLPCALLCLPLLSPSSISYHSICDKRNNQAHVSLS